MEVLDARRMAQADRITIDEVGIPGLVLMENAGRLVAEEVAERVDPPGPALVVCGRGNNGGDGYVVARHLARLGYQVQVVALGGSGSALRGDAAAMARAWRGLGGAVETVGSARTLSRLAPLFEGAAVVVDALFGTGLSRPLEGPAAALVEAINSCPAPVVAVDLPSGLDASSPDVPEVVVEATLTVTFARPKPAQLLPPAEMVCGEVVVVDIGIPAQVVLRTRPDLHWMGAEDAALLLPEREPADHKGRFGHVLVVGGSRGKAGAAALAGWGALRAGAGLVTVAAPEPVRPEVAALAPELMTASLPAGREGTLARDAHRQVLDRLGKCTVLAVGPGLGAGPVVSTEARRLVRSSPLPVVLDADGLGAFVGRHVKTLARHRAPLVITPHPGEAGRLLGSSSAAVQADRLGAARALASMADAVCVLKGHRTLTVSPGGTAIINATGNPGMASGGMGDLLTGIIAALLAQGLEAMEAAALGAYLHGLAADLSLDRGEAPASLVATTVARALPAALRQIGGDPA
ncbi:MAG: NAD(P)H-hydrate dehydratase [Acidobacteriota bacterium]|nr:NAD(P)H-hydrate dehydratase [Acidobacteriota bacterium]MDQ7086634.1 NAD(P)H-hydrate dehydratase [Acidobacteriota bacterium]